jgi:hypothetical protein
MTQNPEERKSHPAGRYQTLTDSGFGLHHKAFRVFAYSNKRPRGPVLEHGTWAAVTTRRSQLSRDSGLAFLIYFLRELYRSQLPIAGHVKT